MASAVPPTQRCERVTHSRVEFYDCLCSRADALFDLTDALLCTDGPVKRLADLTLTTEHRRGHEAIHDAVNHGRLEPRRLRRLLASTPLPRAADGRIVRAPDGRKIVAQPAASAPLLRSLARFEHTDT
ncbi:transposase [Streptomyces sp. NPDC051453]|uniref:transposase n=1 Tax=Streptomyces sp. NPDC051453 TaxID=3154941 RepID=UPI0034170A48